MLPDSTDTTFKLEVLDMAPVIIAVHDREHNITWANRAYLHATGLDLQELQGRKCYSVWGLEKPCQGCPVITAMETGQPQEAELHPGNQKHWPSSQGAWLARATPITDAQGNITGAVETAFEITRQYQAEQELRISKERYSSLLEQASDTIMIHDRHGRILLANQRSSLDLGYSPEELLSMTIQDFNSEIKEIHATNLWNEVLAGQPSITETSHRRKDGSVFPVEVTLSPVTWDTEPAIMGIARNITARKRNETTLRKLSNLNESLLKLGSLDDKMRRITDGVIDILDADFVRIWIERPGDKCESGCRHAETTEGPDPCLDENRCLHLIASSGRYTRLNGAYGRVPFTGSMVGKIGRSEKKGFLLNDISNDPLIHDHSWARKLGLVSCAGRRLISVQGETIGVIALFSKKTLSREDENLLRNIAGTTSAVIQTTASQDALRESEKTYRNLFENSQFGIVRTRINDGRVVSCNKKMAQMFGYDDREEFISEYVFSRNYVDPEQRERLLGKMRKQGHVKNLEAEFYTKNGAKIWARFEAWMFPDDGYIDYVGMDITESRRAEAERERLITCIEQSGEATVITDAAGIIQYVNKAFEHETGYTRFEAIGQNPRILNSGKQSKAFYDDLWATLLRGNIYHGRMVNKRRDGSLYTEDATISPVINSTGEITNFVAVKRNISEQLSMQEQLLQSQKMESVGRLAGGVAHDYNNMLSVILGYTELVMEQLDPAGQLHEDLHEVRQAAMRSVDITRQLLAFARQQTVSPRVIDLNEAVVNMLKMLGRLIGEDINLSWQPVNGGAMVKIDPSQIDQLLANLCVNARDAINGVGRIVIETKTIQLDEAYCLQHPGATAGDYVVLQVKDNGCGIKTENLSKIFEPFFTTKAAGEGTGLGLATVYGIIKQNDGYISVESEPGLGTTVTIYLPSHLESVTTLTECETENSIPQSQGETVLIVEDEAATLKLASRILKELGYTVLGAKSPKVAMDLARSHECEIQLLLTDVVMPEMNGRDLALEFSRIRPELKVLFMSGYTSDIISRQGVLAAGVNFIQKPFFRRELAIKVREVLDKDSD